MKRIVTFTNLFPNRVQPTHGLFVFERMRRVAAAGGFSWRVVAPIPQVCWPLCRGTYRLQATVPGRETWQGVEVEHPRYRHWPGLSMRRQARAMAAGARSVLQRLAAEGPLVLDAHYLWPDGVAAALLAEELGLPFAWTARGSDANVLADDPVVRAALRRHAPRATFVAAVSAALADRVAEVTGLPREQVLVVRNGVDLERFATGDRAAARTALGLPVTGRYLLGVGRLVAGKGFGVAAAALAQLPPDVQLLLVGDGPERAALAAAGGGRVQFLGTRSPAEVALAYQAADLLVLPSEREGWPNVVTEALASGLRVLATPVGGIPEILDHPVPGDERLGALVPVGDVAALAAAARRLLEAPVERAAVRAFASRYGWQAPVQLLCERFWRILGVAA